MQLSGLTLLHSERPKLYVVLAILSAIGLGIGLLGTCSEFHRVLAVLSAIGLSTGLLGTCSEYYRVLAILSAIGLSTGLLGTCCEFHSHWRQKSFLP